MNIQKELEKILPLQRIRTRYIDLVSFETADIEPFAVGIRVMAEAFQICGRGLVSDSDREGDGFWILRIHGIEGESREGLCSMLERGECNCSSLSE